MASRRRVFRPRGSPKVQKPSPAVHSGDGIKDGEDTEQDDGARQAAFEKELSWCITQVQVGLRTGKPTKAQVQEAERILKVLQNPKALLVRKRQMMRQNFGDYRKKMLEEEKKLSKATRPQAYISSTDSPVKESQFFRLSTKKASSSAGALVETNLQNGHAGEIPDNLPQEMELENVDNASCAHNQNDIGRRADQIDTGSNSVVSMDASSTQNKQMVAGNHGNQTNQTQNTSITLQNQSQCANSTMENISSSDLFGNCAGLDAQFKFLKSNNSFRFNFT